MLTFVGLGLYDEGDISCKGLDWVQSADYLYLEGYTSRLTGTTVERLQALFKKKVHTLDRHTIEQNPGELLERARTAHVVLLSGGDPMVSTTHIDLRMRAAAAGIQTHIIHGASISTAVCGITGLQNYRFGKSCSIPYPQKGWFPVTPWETVRLNLNLNLHTLVYLDIQPDRFMTIPEGIEILERMASKTGAEPPSLYVGVARAGSQEPHVAAGSGEEMKKIDFGPPLHILAVPAELHPMEREYLEIFARL